MVILGGDPRPPKRPKFPKFEVMARECVNLNSNAWRPATAKNWRIQLAMLNGAMGDTPVDLLTPERIAEAKPPMQKQQSTKTRQVLELAVAEGLIDVNPAVAAGSLLPTNGHKTKHHESVPWADLPGILAKVPDDDNGRCLKFLAFTAGCSVRERATRRIAFPTPRATS